MGVCGYMVLWRKTQKMSVNGYFDLFHCFRSLTSYSTHHFNLKKLKLATVYQLFIHVSVRARACVCVFTCIINWHTSKYYGRYTLPHANKRGKTDCFFPIYVHHMLLFSYNKSVIVLALFFNRFPNRWTEYTDQPKAASRCSCSTFLHPSSQKCSYDFSQWMFACPCVCVCVYVCVFRVCKSNFCHTCKIQYESNVYWNVQTNEMKTKTKPHANEWYSCIDTRNR